MVRIITLASFMLLLTSCTILHTTQEEDRIARCKLLNRQIIFNGATANQTQAIKERAQLDTLNQDYRVDDCNEPMG